jgi:hypothetical protein
MTVLIMVNINPILESKPVKLVNLLVKNVPLPPFVPTV